MDETEINSLKVICYDSCTTKNSKETTLKEVVESIKNNTLLRDAVRDYRLARNSEREHAKNPEPGAVMPAGGVQTAEQLKHKLPAILPAVHVNGGRRKCHIDAFTGITLCDFDHVPRERLTEVCRLVKEDPHTLLSYITCSGEGLRVLARYDIPRGATLDENAKAYAKRFQYVNEYYQHLTGLEYDAKCKDVVRLSIVSWDPTAHYNPQATPFTVKEMKAMTEGKRQAESKRRTEARRKQKQEQMDVDTVFGQFIEPLLQNAGKRFEPGAHNDYISTLGYQLNKFGVDQETAMIWAQSRYGQEYPQTLSVIASCYTHTEEHGIYAEYAQKQLQRPAKMARATSEEIQSFLQTRIEAHRNEVKGRVEIRWTKVDEAELRSITEERTQMFTPVTDEDLNTLSSYIEKDCYLKATSDDIYKRLRSHATPPFDPFLAYLDSLPEWAPDRDPDYLAEMARRVRILDEDPTMQDFFELILKKFMTAMVECWIKADKVNHLFLVFIGQQGVFKTTFMTHLLPPELSEYLKVKLNCAITDKDDKLALSAFGCMLFEELDTMNNEVNNNLKAMMTTVYTDEREPYARTPTRRTNRCSFCGTANNEKLLTDLTGSRRWAVFRVDVTDPPTDDRPFDYTGIFSQIKHYIHDREFRSYLSREEQTRLQEHNIQFQTAVGEKELIQTLYAKPKGPDDSNAKWISASDIFKHLKEYSPSSKIHLNRIGSVLKQLGYEPMRRGNGRVGYVLVERMWTDIENERRQAAHDLMNE